MLETAHESMYAFILPKFLCYSSIMAMYTIRMFCKSIVDKDMSNPEQFVLLCFETQVV